MKELSKLAKDRPMSAVDTAVWWTEYILRTDDASHLKSQGIHQAWWERRLLHIWAGVFGTLFIGIYALLRLLCWGLRTILGGRKCNDKSGKKKSSKNDKKKQIIIELKSKPSLRQNFSTLSLELPPFPHPGG